MPDITESTKTDDADKVGFDQETLMETGDNFSSVKQTCISFLFTSKNLNLYCSGNLQKLQSDPEQTNSESINIFDFNSSLIVDELSMNASDYKIVGPVGYGSSAIVYLAEYLPENKCVAIKIIELDRFEKCQIDALRREIQVMRLCRHPNLLKILASFVNDAQLWIVAPFLAAGSCLDLLKTVLNKNGISSEAVIAYILQQTLQGLNYLHENGHIHRDVKAGNLLISHPNIVQLADFGVSASLLDNGNDCDGGRNRGRKTFVGTPCWMAPEVMEMTKGYDEKADIWSLGITAYELANGQAPCAKLPAMKVNKTYYHDLKF